MAAVASSSQLQRMGGQSAAGAPGAPGGGGDGNDPNRRKNLPTDKGDIPKGTANVPKIVIALRSIKHGDRFILMDPRVVGDLLIILQQANYLVSTKECNAAFLRGWLDAEITDTGLVSEDLPDGPAFLLDWRDLDSPHNIGSVSSAFFYESYSYN
jgi:hypothetical protein